MPALGAASQPPLPNRDKPSRYYRIIGIYSVTDAKTRILLGNMKAQDIS